MSSILAGPSLGVHKPKGVSIFGGDIPTLLYSDPALGGDGKTRLNPDKVLAKWKWIAATFGNDDTPSIGPGQTRFMTLSVRSSGDNDQGDFEAATILMRSINASGTAVRSAVRPYVNTPTCNRYLSNIVIPSTLITGTAQLPGVFRTYIYCLPKTSWQFEVRNLDSSATLIPSISLFGRQFTSCSPCSAEQYRRRAMHLQWFHPYWIGPQDPTDINLTGPTVTLPANASRELTFPVPSNADFLMAGMLDDSTGASSGESPSLYAQVRQNDSQRPLAILSALVPPTGSSQLGISWRDFLAIPSVSVTGFPGGRVNAYSLAPNVGGTTHLIPRNSQVIVRFTNTSASEPVNLRPALFGLLIYGKQPEDRQTSVDGAANRERIAQGEEFLRRMGLTTPFGTGRPR